MNKTDQIFQLTTPYAMKDQGPWTRLLFVCSAGLLRSATGADLYTKKGYNTRACGTHPYALVPLSGNLIMWANHIIFVHDKNWDKAIETFWNTQFWGDLNKKAIVLNIEDDYNFRQQELIDAYEWQMQRHHIKDYANE